MFGQDDKEPIWPTLLMYAVLLVFVAGILRMTYVMTMRLIHGQ